MSGQRRTLSTNLFTKGQNGLQSRSVQHASNCCNVLNQNSIVFMPSIFNISKNQQIRSYYLESTFPDSEKRDLEPGEERLNLMRVQRRGIVLKRPKKRNPLGENVPFAKAIVLKTLIKKPKKPNSANRKCVLVRTSAGKELVAYVPGEGHNLQEHNVVLVKVARLRDTPGVKIKCVRGAYDLGHVIKKKQL
ncbi:40S ribosomal protein S12, mitochondrial [Armadillidium vulgare]|nr:40S ribosomal protein S12, mitochondrial [Armadillidium vulgare]